MADNFIGTDYTGLVGIGNGTFALVMDGALLPWSWSGYGAPLQLAPDASVEQLTPPTIVAILAAGYRPELHPTATGRLTLR